MEENKTKAKIIAVAGKGGVGKTSLCSAIVRELVEAFPGKRILAIDADPAVGLSTALGVHVKHTIDDIRNEVIQTSERGEYRQAIEVLNEARFRIFDTMVECEGFAFLAIGRPEAAGCYCSVNSYLKEVISMLANDFDYVVIDGEAGIEQISRRVMEQVSHLVLVTDLPRRLRQSLHGHRHDRQPRRRPEHERSRQARRGAGARLHPHRSAARRQRHPRQERV